MRSTDRTFALGRSQKIYALLTYSGLVGTRDNSRISAGELQVYSRGSSRLRYMSAAIVIAKVIHFQPCIQKVFYFFLSIYPLTFFVSIKYLISKYSFLINFFCAALFSNKLQRYLNTLILKNVLFLRYISIFYCLQRPISLLGTSSGQFVLVYRVVLCFICAPLCDLYRRFFYLKDKKI